MTPRLDDRLLIDYYNQLLIIIINQISQADPDGGASPAGGLRQGRRDVRHPLRRHAAHQQEEESSLQEGEEVWSHFFIN